MTSPAFHGIIPPLVTPLDEQGQVDLVGLERLVERLIDGKVQGLFVLGTTGEGPSLPQTAQQQVVSAVCDQVSGRLPVLVGITNTVWAHSLEVADAAYAAGAAAVVLAPPYYLPMTQAELLGYTQRLVDRSPLPVMLYNMPGCCKTWYEVETVCRLSELPRCLGVERQFGRFGLSAASRGRRRRSRPDFALFVGPEEILVSAMRLGAHGGVHGGANMFPRLYVADVPSCRAAAIGPKPNVCSNWCYTFRSPSTRSVKARRGSSRGSRRRWTCWASVRTHMAEPFHDMTPTAASRFATLCSVCLLNWDRWLWS